MSQLKSNLSNLSLNQQQLREHICTAPPCQLYNNREEKITEMLGRYHSVSVFQIPSINSLISSQLRLVGYLCYSVPEFHSISEILWTNYLLKFLTVESEN